MSGPFGSQQWAYNAGGGFYGTTIDQSLRLNGVDSNLARTHTAGDRQKFTWSGWVKFATDNIFSLFETFAGGTDFTQFTLQTSGTINFYHIASAVDYGGNTTQRLRDPSAWYHIVIRVDTTQASAGDRVRVYVNGTQFETDPFTDYGSIPQNTNTYINTARTHRMGYNQNVGGGGAPTTQANAFGNGYLAEVHFCDGQSYAPTEFGETSNGIWVPITPSVTYGTNGFHLAFSDTSAIGDDTSGQGNDWTVDDIAAEDVVPDSPTNNFATIFPMPNTSLSEGDLKLTTSRTGYWDGTIGSFGVTSGKWYHEVRFSKTEANFRCVAGWIGNEAAQTVVLNGKGITGDPHTTLFDNYSTTSWLTTYYKDGSTNGTWTTPASGDVINIAADFDNGKIWFGINGTYYANDGGTDGDPGAGTNESLSGIDLNASEYVPFFQIRSDSSAGGNVMIANFGADDTFAGNETAGGYSDGNGYGSFFNTVPSGFLALCSANLDEPAIGPNSETTSDEHFDTALWTADVTNPAAGDKSISLLFQPDLVWSKNRDNAENHYWMDSVRGDNAGNKWLRSNSTAAEGADAIGSTTAKYDFTSTGFDIIDTDSTSGEVYYSSTSRTYVGWCWKAGGTAVSNTDGSITSSVSANQDAGFSIVSYTGDGTTAAGSNVGHGLTQAPEAIIVKDRDAATNWNAWFTGFAGNQVIYPNLTNQRNTDPNVWSATVPTASVFYVGNSEVNAARDYIAYCFHSVEGFSKVGSYVGNGSADGTFVYTGFRPAWVMIKRTDTTGSWNIADAVRSPDNEVDEQLQANLTNAESTTFDFDFTSNGFKARTTDGARNASGGSYTYLAFAEAPFKYANAR